MTADLGMAFDFNVIKPLVRGITEYLDEYVLIPQKSPYLIIGQKLDSVHVSFADKKYVFPASDIRLLNVVNITAEELSKYIAEELLKELQKQPSAFKQIREFSIGVQESRGQTVIYRVSLKA